jgi:hypothetical protein
MTGKTLAIWLRANPMEAALYVKPGRDYTISADDLDRIYSAMKNAPARKAMINVESPMLLSEAKMYEKLQKLTKGNAPKRPRCAANILSRPNGLACHLRASSRE